MKTLFVSAFLMLSFISVNVFAQEESEVVTDEEIEKFAVMEDSVMAFYEKKNIELIDMIRNNEVIEGAGRYNEIKAAWDDEEKLAEIEITDDEKAAYEEILAFMGSLGDEVRELKIELIKNDEILGVATFNKVNKAMKEDPEVKEKVESLQAELKEKRTEDEDTESGTGA
ncbi:hypothetical protein [Lunatibacter salilacus]|uniref:hypothetical protein n=1 Tax=Lunatibacter salilacus TaxID=2483804 RepID=UPI00131C20C2|nr:hypothetical protein [Lunatibacter salilacus]